MTKKQLLNKKLTMETFLEKSKKTLPQKTHSRTIRKQRENRAKTWKNQE